MCNACPRPRHRPGRGASHGGPVYLPAESWAVSRLGLAAAWLWEKAPAQKKPGPFVKLFIGATAACMVFFLCFATIGQTGVWKNSLSLWTYVIDKGA